MRSAITATLVAALLLISAAARAQDPRTDGVLARIDLTVSQDTMVTTHAGVRDGLFVIDTWLQDRDLGPGLSLLDSRILKGYRLLSVRGTHERVVLEVGPDVRAVEVRRPDPETLRILFLPHRFAGGLDRYRRQVAARDATSAWDERLRGILQEQPTLPPPPPAWEGFHFPIGPSSVVRPPRTRNRITPPPPPPAVLSLAWTGDELFARAIANSDQGDRLTAHLVLRGDPAPRSEARDALTAAARGWIWGRLGPSGEAGDPGIAADSFLLAAGLAPRAPWRHWALAQAGWQYEQLGMMHEAEWWLSQAAEAATDERDRARWRLTAAQARLIGEADTHSNLQSVAEVARHLGGAMDDATELRAASLRLVADALWRADDPARAARVADLLLEVDPQPSAATLELVAWLYLDARRYDDAAGYIDRLLDAAVTPQRLERGLWYRHELGVSRRDAVMAYRALAELRRRAPRSVLLPLADIRQLLLEAIIKRESGKRVAWQDLGLELRRIALRWPHTPVEWEAIAFAAQILGRLGLHRDALELALWLSRQEDAQMPAGSDELLCEQGERTFEELMSQGEELIAAGLYARALSSDRVRSCLSPDHALRAADAAVGAGLPKLALRWMGLALAEGVAPERRRETFARMARMYVRAGQLTAAEQSLAFLDRGATAQDANSAARAATDVAFQRASGHPAEATRRAEAWLTEHAEAPARERARVELALADAAEEAAEPAAAARALADAVEHDPSRADAALRLRRAALLNQASRQDGDWQLAADAVFAVRGDVIPPERAREVDLYEAEAALASEDPSAALETLRRLSRGTDIWALRSRELLRRRSFSEALAPLEEVLQARR